MIDIHYTPENITHQMVEALPKGFKPSTVVDFAAGEGALLTAASCRWSSARIYANDISPAAIGFLADQFPTWNLSVSDFLKEQDSEKYDLIMLNPPFSQKGTTPFSWEDFGYQNVKSGLAAFFIFKALQSLSDDGYLLAVVPEGCLIGERDEHAWQIINRNFSIKMFQSNDRKAFKKASVSTSIIKIKKRKIGKKTELKRNCRKLSKNSFITRGSLQMHKRENHLSRNGFTLIHSTNLKDGFVKIETNERFDFPHNTISSSGLLIPRVGKMKPDKICILPSSSETYVLSDCVFAVPCADETVAEDLKRDILLNWAEFMGLYGGTGAPYTTLKKLESFISQSISRSMLEVNMVSKEIQRRSV